MVRLFGRQHAATSSIVAGSEMAVQERKSTEPTMTAGQCGHEDDDQVAGHRHQVEDQQRPLGAEAVGEVAAGKGVERGEQVVEAVEQPDREIAPPPSARR